MLRIMQKIRLKTTLLSSIPIILLQAWHKVSRKSTWLRAHRLPITLSDIFTRAAAASKHVYPSSSQVALNKDGISIGT